MLWVTQADLPELWQEWTRRPDASPSSGRGYWQRNGGVVAGRRARRTRNTASQTARVMSSI